VADSLKYLNTVRKTTEQTNSKIIINSVDSSMSLNLE
jgi:hypothetical protein